MAFVIVVTEKPFSKDGISNKSSTNANSLGNIYKISSIQVYPNQLKAHSHK